MRFLVIDFAEFFPLAVAYLGFFSVPVDFKLEGLLGGWFVGCFFFIWCNNRHGFMASILKMGNFPYGPCLPAGLIMF